MSPFTRYNVGIYSQPFNTQTPRNAAYVHIIHILSNGLFFLVVSVSISTTHLTSSRCDSFAIYRLTLPRTSIPQAPQSFQPHSSPYSSMFI